MRDDKPLWVPSRASIEASPMYAFMEKCNRDFGLSLAGYDDLHAFSVADRERFWTSVWEFCGIKGERGTSALRNGDAMLDARFFPDATLNFAENLLSGEGVGDALIFRGKTRLPIAGAGAGCVAWFPGCSKHSRLWV